MGLPIVQGTKPNAEDFNLFQPRAHDGANVGDYLDAMRPMTALVQLTDYDGSATVVRMIIGENVLFYLRDDNDITSPASPDGLLLVDQLGRRWKRMQIVGAGASLTMVNVFSKNQSVAPVPLVSAEVIATDASLSNNFKLVLSHHGTLENPGNMTDGMVLNWVVKQAEPGSWTLAYGSCFDFGATGIPVLSAADGAVDLISGYYDDAEGKVLCSVRKAT